MMNATTKTVLAAALAASSCGMETAIEATSSAVLNQDTYLYFRCSATGWEPNSATWLRSSTDPYLFTLVYEVNQDWMVSGGDSCVFTETDQAGGWGTVQRSFGSRNGSIVVPDGSMLMQDSGNFTVRYPSRGRYKVTVNWRDGLFNIARLSGVEAWEPCSNDRVSTIADSAAAPATMAVGCSNGDIFLTSTGKDAEPTWTKIDSWSTSTGVYDMPGLPINALTFSPRDPKTIYVAFAGSKQGHKLWKTVTGGQSWLELSTVPVGEIWSISVNPLATQRVYVAGPGEAVAISTDGGNTWSGSAADDPLQPPLAAGASISSVAVGNNQLNQVWVGATNGEIFLTTDATGAQSWIKAGNPLAGSPALPARMVTRLRTNPTIMWPPEVYATYAGLLNDSVWASRNGGESWVNLHNAALPTTQIPVGVAAFYGVSVSPVDANVLYVNGSYGIGRSTDRGASWSWR